MQMQAAAQVLIRPLQNADERRRCAEFMAGSEPWITLRRTYEDGLRFLLDPTREVYVAAIKDAIAGFIVLNLRGPLNGYIQTICVAPERRNLGIGRQLIAFAEERIFRESPNVFLCVSSFNTRAQKLYARLGYDRVGELKDYVVKGHSEILMRKTQGSLADFHPGSTGSKKNRRAGGKKRSRSRDAS